MTGYEFIDHKRKIKAIQLELQSKENEEKKELGIDLEKFIALQYLSDRMDTL